MPLTIKSDKTRWLKNVVRIPRIKIGIRLTVHDLGDSRVYVNM